MIDTTHQTPPSSGHGYSQCAEQLLLSGYFSQLREQQIIVKDIVGNFDVHLEDAERAVAELEAQGYLEGVPSAGGHPPRFKPTSAGRRAAENLKRERGLRHPALVYQERHDAADLLLSVAMVPWVVAEQEGQSILSPFFWKHICFFLDSISYERLYAAFRNLDENGFVNSGTTTPLVLGDSNQINLTERGKRRYYEHVAPRLGLERNKSILDQTLEKTIDIFYAFQTEYGHSRNWIDEALKTTTTAIDALPGLVRPTRILIASDAGDGAVRIDSQLLDRIKASAIVVADLTPVEVSKSGKRLRMNDCVLVEAGYALASKAADDILLLAQQRAEPDFRGDFDNPQGPFDLHTVRRIQFSTKDELRRKLRTELEAILRRKGWLHG